MTNLKEGQITSLFQKSLKRVRDNSLFKSHDFLCKSKKGNRRRQDTHTHTWNTWRGSQRENGIFVSRVQRRMRGKKRGRDDISVKGCPFESHFRSIVLSTERVCVVSIFGLQLQFFLQFHQMKGRGVQEEGYERNPNRFDKTNRGRIEGRNLHSSLLMHLMTQTHGSGSIDTFFFLFLLPVTFSEESGSNDHFLFWWQSSWRKESLLTLFILSLSLSFSWPQRKPKKMLEEEDQSLSSSRWCKKWEKCKYLFDIRFAFVFFSSRIPSVNSCLWWNLFCRLLSFLLRSTFVLHWLNNTTTSLSCSDNNI